MARKSIVKQDEVLQLVYDEHGERRRDSPGNGDLKKPGETIR